ncbi:laminin subunit alpha-like [Oppia nitens]|uniref:laminin subunit alpha-like n=1 Tax=Oppia nitens TaxID=1686743 RepID=UPI0023DB2DE5|nr:laminin subunit alpha-like [Oppia nitens]
MRDNAIVRCTKHWPLVLLIAVCLNPYDLVSAQVLNPPYFNLAEGRNITATATCGENLPEPELYCKLVGSNWLDKPDNVHINLIQGQACDYCDPNDQNRAHPPQYAIDGTERWWQSPPLSRGTKYNEVNLTIDLGQEFNVAYVFIKMGNSPRPGVWALEKSRDYGKVFTPWQYFADTPGDCVHYFGPQSLGPIIRDDSVLCETRFSKVVPLEGGEIAISLLNGRPSADNFSISAALQEWSIATNIRLRLLRPKTTLGHLLSVARQDPTVTRRYFYSIKDINIGGRCVCNGHASQCDQIDPNDPYRVSCKCTRNTCGNQCERCCPGYQQKEWRRATINNPYVCEKCNCFDHSEECLYDKQIDNKKLSLDINGKYNGGGVCVNCRHNTEGINCNKCKSGFFRPRNKPLDAPDVCQPCNCNTHYSTGNCTEGNGQCECKPNFLSPLCDQCSYGYFGYPECQECHCFPNGTHGNVCELRTGSCPCIEGYTGKFCKQCAQRYYGFPKCESCNCHTTHSVTDVCDISSGQCQCAHSFGGRKCNECDVGFYDYPRCQFCSCDPSGTTDKICNNQTGICFCKEGYAGNRCDTCAPNYYGFPNCTKCMCDEIGSYSQLCDMYGKCVCRQNFGGLKCGDCSPGFYKYPECLPCSCDYRGSNGVSCDYAGRCICGDRFEGEKCDKCREGYYNFPRCEECNCNPAGLVAQFGGCDKVQEGKLCECKQRVTGRICNQCKDLYWNLQITNPFGCEDCLCNPNGTINGIGLCNTESGECLCKHNVKGRVCDSCKDETYGLTSGNVFGCVSCNCDFGGSIHSVCNKTTGQCYCRPRVKGQRCTEPMDVMYFPTFYQFQYEAEDWRNPTGSPARFGYDSDLFNDFSWRGYATFTDLQREIITNITIQKPSIYRLIIRFVNLNSETISGTLTLTPSESFGETQQSSSIHFEPTKDPKLVYVVGKPGLIIPPFVLNPGQWGASLKVDKNDLLVDYIVLIPQSYFDQTIYEERTTAPCKLNAQHNCRHYAYPDFPEESSIVRAQSAFIMDGDIRSNAEVLNDLDVIKKLNYEGNMARLDSRQSKIFVDLAVNKPDSYAFIISYHNPFSDDIKNNESSKLTLEIKNTNGDIIKTSNVMLGNCPYSFICRQIVTEPSGQIGTHELDSSFIQLSLGLPNSLAEDRIIILDAIAAVPYPNNWRIDNLIPRFVCIKKNGQCIESTFSVVPEANKIELEKDQNKDRISSRLPFESKDSLDPSLPKLIYLEEKEPTVDIRGTVPRKGLYTFVLHYFQPENPGFELEALIQNGLFHNGIISVDHCPSRTGCRSLIRQRDTNVTFFQVEDSFMLTLKAPERKNIWVDYILAVPVDHYDPAILEVKPEDKSTNLMSQCFKNSFYINTDEANEACRAFIFSITVDFNGGALPCQCNTDGSHDFKCKHFGGQCNCKPNVIGRTCSRCKTGFYGFPQCKPCNCPSTAVCHQVTGECICPRGVTGEQCNKCLPLTFGFDPIIGCVDCDCEPYGVQNRDLQCDVETGNCNCKSNIIGRNCNKCKSGFWSYPHCQYCRCDLRGTTDDICDQSTSRCFCKDNVDGEYCDQCKPDSYYLEENNVLGCTKCFCFGTTDRCTSSSLKTIQLSAMDVGWKVVTLLFTEKYMRVHSVSDQHASVEYESGKIKSKQPTVTASDTTDNIILYYSLPEQYLGNRITSYGGLLRYKILNNNKNSLDSTSFGAADLVLEGNNITIIHEHIEQPAIDETFEFRAKIIEREFRHLNGHDVSREQLMMVLVKLKAIYIRGTYFDPISEIVLENVLLDKSVDGKRMSDAPRSFTVEQCICPPNYKGTSCEDCASGYYRAPTGPYLGFCVPCSCNGKSNECDPITGKCFNCQFNTEGDHCERCISGYHGDATRGTPYDCLICACPLPLASNNFATSCEVSPNGLEISCQCNQGYYGTRCDVCAAGHYGRPEVIGSSCQSCNCSGNIDYEDPTSCESTTGQCLKCLHNTGGSDCERCVNGYYGDAIHTKNCSECLCDNCGTDVCNHLTGQCQCRTNVVGDNCDRCALDHWDFKSCQGCRKCLCQIGAIGTNCDDETGQCMCRPGVTGKKCEICEPGYWKYSQFGCTSCNCVDKYSYGAVCDQQTGQCQCMPGVIGDKCDSCPHRWVFIPKSGCHECGLCVHELLDDTDGLQQLIDPLRLEIQDTSSSVFAYRRLSHVNKSLLKNEELVNEMKKNPKQINLVPLFTKAQNLNDEVDSLLSKSDSTLKQVAKVLVDALALREDSITNDKLISESIVKTSLVVEDIKKLEEGFRLASVQIGQSIDRRVSEADWMAQEVRNRTFTESHNKSKVELEEAKRFLENIEVFIEPAISTKNQINVTLNNVLNVIKLLSELMNKSHDSLKIIVKVEELNSQSLNRQFDRYLNSIKSDNEDVQQMISKANELLDDTKKSLTSSESLIIDLAQMSRRLKSDTTKFNETMINRQSEVDQIHPKVSNAVSHASSLKKQSEELERMFSDTRNKATDPLKAANAYNSIVDLLENATKGSNSAIENSQKVSTDSALRDLLEYKTKSHDLSNDSQNLNRKVNTELADPLSQSILKVNNIENHINSSTINKKNIEEELKKLPNLKSIQELGIKVTTAVDMAEVSTKKNNDNVEELVTKIEQMKENTDKVPQDLNDVSNAIRMSQSYIEHISSHTPGKNKIDEIRAHYDKLRAQRDGYKQIIHDLQRKIDLARHQANRIKVATEFRTDSHLQLNNPVSLRESATHTKLSLFFRTSEPNGLLAYIGNPIAILQKSKQKRQSDSDDEEKKEDEDTVNSRRKATDFMSLEIQSGNVVLTWDLGSGASNPIRNDKYVSDWKWHQVIVERIGKSVKVVVKSPPEEGDPIDVSTIEGSLQGPSSVFNLDQQYSRIFIGGIPDNIHIQNEVQYKRFKGFIEDIVLGENPLGLWNFRESNNVLATKEREALGNLESADGLYFDGSGYAILPRGRLNLTIETYIRLKFKTFAKDGLLFLIGHERDFLAIEMRDGLVNFKYDLGSGPYAITSGETYNDGKWHSLIANRFEKEGAISIDGIPKTHGEAIGLNKELSTTDDIYIGGYPNHHFYYEVTNVDFEGCLKELQIGTEQQNLQNIKEMLRAVPGCPSTSGRTASFSNDSTGYVAIESNLNLDRNVQITLNFKTINPKGLLFFVSNADLSSNLAIYLEDGTLNLKVQPGGSIRTEHRTYNDKQWHYITASFTPERLRLDVDDINAFTIETNEKNELTLGETKTIYFGGVPQQISSLENFDSSIPTSFVGCLGDATVNEKVQNFADTNNRVNASLTSCPLTDHMSPYDETKEEIRPITDAIRSTDKPNGMVETTSRVPYIITRSTTQPPPIGQCRLSRVPSKDSKTSGDNALRFGDTHWSRHEFSISSEVANDLTDESGFQIEFKTTQEEGVIFYVTSANHIDYVSLYLMEGKVHYAWDCGSGRAIIASNYNYSDGQWHKVTFSRKGQRGLLRIDDEREEYSSMSAGQTNSLNVKSPIYIGGIPEELSKSAKNNLRGIDKPGSLSSHVVTSFPGCLRELTIHANKYDFGVQSVGYNVSQCVDSVELGSFFHSDGGHIRLYDEFRVGSQFFINLEIKPRTLSGVLLAVFGKSDYLLIYLNDGDLIFSVDNGAGAINVTFNPSSKYYFCDGEWHTVQASKINNVVTLSIDKQSLEPGIGIGGVSSTDTKDPLYIGGVPVDVKQSKGLVDNFVGCLRILEMNSRRHSLTQARIEGHVTLNTCSTL